MLRITCFIPHTPYYILYTGKACQTQTDADFAISTATNKKSLKRCHQDEERRTVSLQERLKNLAGMSGPPAVAAGGDDGAFFSAPPPLPMSIPPPAVAPIGSPPSIFSPHLPPPPPPPPPQQNFSPRGARFDSPRRPHFPPGDFRPHRPRHENFSNFSPMRGGGGMRGRPGPRW
jgi:hypothetical protein